MAYYNKSRIVPAFPDIKVPEGGRYGGAILGLKAMIEGRSKSEELALKKEALTSDKLKNSLSIYNQIVTDYNKEADRINDLNKEILKKLPEKEYKRRVKNNLGFEDLYSPYPQRPPSFQEFMGTSTAGSNLLGSGNTDVPADPNRTWSGGSPNPNPQITKPSDVSMGSKLMAGGMSALRELPNTAKSLMPQAIQGMSQGAGMMQNVGQQLQQLLGAPEAHAMQSNVSLPSPASIQESPNTQSMISSLDDYDNADEAIRDLVELDNKYDQAGLYLGENIDNNAFLEAFRAKFGDDAVRRLQQMVS